MADRSFSDPDDWHGVHDSRKRKQIQNRLAQRARRKRLARTNPIKDRPQFLRGSPSLSEEVTDSSGVSTNSSQALVHVSASTFGYHRMPSPSPTDVRLESTTFAGLAPTIVVSQPLPGGMLHDYLLP